MYKDLIDIPDISARVFLELNLHQQTSNIKDLIEIPNISARVFLDLIWIRLSITAANGDKHKLLTLNRRYSQLQMVINTNFYH